MRIKVILLLGLLFLQPPLLAKKMTNIDKITLKSCSKKICININSKVAIQGQADESYYFNALNLKVYIISGNSKELQSQFFGSRGSFDPEIEVLTLQLDKEKSNLNYSELVLHLPSGRIDFY